jgi:hypothetical protein
MWARYENENTTEKIDTLKIISCNHSAEFFANDISSSDLPNHTICNKTGTVNFRAEIEGLSQEVGSLKWFITYPIFGEKEETDFQDYLTWSKNFETGTYPIRMWVRYDNGEEDEIISTLNVEVFWIKMQNVRH